ncbi:hypothetical protein C8A01DRAFT_16975 [Parachaetomium inaequale]|uniref:Uncharacterized protein n=1 Tax=Parachaetomium inaequale TaxID=2588326 RepID=A0AAN6PDQ2_9PEZI|nr:hypothetical protein C8A01DRAFT_16975 [Parachaetomium inaequale]
MSEPPLLRMPLHLLSIVLSQLDNTTSLASAIFSHSSLFAAFSEDRDRIIRTIFRNQIPPALLGYAFLTSRASSPDLDRCDFDNIGNCFSDFYFDFNFGCRVREHILTSESPLDVRLVNTLSRTHAIIEHFTRDLVQDTLPLARTELGLRGKHGATDLEVFRIQRAMYCFQVYCNLFRHPYDRPQRRRLGTVLAVYFFGENYSPWVHEQLACIHDYFERVLSRAFDEVAAHDVEWGYKSINWLAVAGWNEHKQGYLFRGLDFLYELDTAKTYDERREILGDSPPRTRHMLGTTLWKDGSTRSWWDEWHYFWEYIDTVSYEKHWFRFNIISPSDDAHWSGPFRMWRIAHADCWREDIIFHLDHEWLRRCGYVLWDFPEALFTDDELRERILQGRQKAWIDRFRRNDGQLKSRIKHSRRERAEIYKRGGRGYWSEGNLSRIVWTEGAPS